MTEAAFCEATAFCQARWLASVRRLCKASKTLLPHHWKFCCASCGDRLFTVVWRKIGSLPAGGAGEFVLALSLVHRLSIGAARTAAGTAPRTRPPACRSGRLPGKTSVSDRNRSMLVAMMLTKR